VDKKYVQYNFRFKTYGKIRIMKINVTHISSVAWNFIKVNDSSINLIVVWDTINSSTTNASNAVGSTKYPSLQKFTTI
jgi:hypothetical protein